MASPRTIRLVRDDSLEEFEFLDMEGDLDVDLSKSPIIGAMEKLHSGISLLISALCAIIEEQGMEVTIPISAVAKTAIGALTGSFLGGPAGLAIGLVTGAVLAYRASPLRSRNTKSDSKTSTIRQVFSQMTFQQKKDLLKDLLGSLKQPNVRVLVVEILKNEEIRNMTVNILSQFLMKKMGICLTKAK